jgi:hypothetical protein
MEVQISRDILKRYLEIAFYVDEYEWHQFLREHPRTFDNGIGVDAASAAAALFRFALWRAERNSSSSATVVEVEVADVSEQSQLPPC